jgi:hypothetical protein
MTADFVIITPEIAAGSGGVADHTLALLREWRMRDAPTILAPNAPDVGESGVNVQRLGLTTTEISNQLPETTGRIFVQYSAYGFSRLGYPRNLIRALVDWRKTARSGVLVLMFHEIWTFWPFLNKNFLIQRWHRRSIKQLLGVCDAVFTTTASQAEHLQALAPGVAVQILPVGSNVRPIQSRPGEREKGVAVLFGLQTSRIRALEQMQPGLADLVRAGCIERIAAIGGDSNETGKQRERELLEELNLRGGFVQYGSLDERKVSDLLSSASFGIFGQSELSCHKSGSFMAYAAHGLNVIANFAQPGKPPPICWLVSPSELLAGLPQSELSRRAECLRRWQEENCSWKVIANTVGRALGIQST